MSPNPHRRARGAETQRVVADRFRTLYPHAVAVGAGSPGRDVLHTPGIAVEVKARRDLNLTAWLRQATRAAGTDVPLVVHRPDGFGPATVDVWPVTFRLVDAVHVLHLAGFGEVAP